MDIWTGIGINIVLQLISNRKEAPKYYAALAKIFNSIALAAAADPRLRAEIEHQEAKSAAK